jgi:hypothetical protein
MVIYRSYVAPIRFNGPVDVAKQGMEISCKKTRVDLAQDRIESEECHPLGLAGQTSFLWAVNRYEGLVGASRRIHAATSLQGATHTSFLSTA